MSEEAPAPSQFPCCSVIGSGDVCTAATRKSSRPRDHTSFLDINRLVVRFLHSSEQKGGGLSLVEAQEVTDPEAAAVS